MMKWRPISALMALIAACAALPASAAGAGGGGGAAHYLMLEKIEAVIVDGPAPAAILDVGLALSSPHAEALSPRLPQIRSRLLLALIEFARLEAARGRTVDGPRLHRALSAALRPDFADARLLVTHIRIRER